MIRNMQKDNYQTESFFDFRFSNFSMNCFCVRGFEDSILRLSSSSLIGNGETPCLFFVFDMILELEPASQICGKIKSRTPILSDFFLCGFSANSGNNFIIKLKNVQNGN